MELESAKEAASIYLIPSLDRAQAEEETQPVSGQLWTLRRFLSNATAAAVFFVLALNPAMQPKSPKNTKRNASVKHIILDNDQLYLQELDTAIDECLEACEIGDVFSMMTACACCKANEGIDLHTLVKSTSPKMHATLQNLADILIMKPLLAERGCAMLREKLEQKSFIDCRRLLISMLPPDDDPILNTSWRVASPLRTFLEEEVRANLVSDPTKSRIMERRHRMIGHLVTKK